LLVQFPFSLHYSFHYAPISIRAITIAVYNDKVDIL
jgi:hypothetical protein